MMRTHETNQKLFHVGETSNVQTPFIIFICNAFGLSCLSLKSVRIITRQLVIPNTVIPTGS